MKLLHPYENSLFFVFVLIIFFLSLLLFFFFAQSLFPLFLFFSRKNFSKQKVEKETEKDKKKKRSKELFSLVMQNNFVK